MLYTHICIFMDFPMYFCVYAFCASVYNLFLDGYKTVNLTSSSTNVFDDFGNS